MVESRRRRRAHRGTGPRGTRAVGDGAPAAPAAAPDDLKLDEAAFLGKKTATAEGTAETDNRGAGIGENVILGSRTVDADDGLAEMLERATGSPLNHDGSPVEPAAPAAIAVEQFPGLCMGASMLTSLALHRIGYGPLTKEEGDALTAALLKNAQAWDLGTMLENPRAAAGLDLAGCLIAILMPRILAEAKSKQASPTQAATAARDVSDDAPAPTA